MGLYCDVVSNDNYLNVKVRDSGLGIKEADIDSLFNIFGTLDQHKSVNKTGAGLGLTISKALCKQLGGNISVSSEYGKGSVFEFFIKDVQDKQTEVVNLKLEDISRGNSTSFAFPRLNQHTILKSKETSCELPPIRAHLNAGAAAVAVAQDSS